MTKNGTHKGGQKGSPSPQNRDVNAANRAAYAMRLRASKLTYEQIAKAAGYANASSCRRAILRELDRSVVAEKADILRNQELAMLDQLHQQVWAMAMDKNKDERIRLTAVDRLISLSERRSRLMGLEKRPDSLDGPQVVIRMVPGGYLGTLPPPPEGKLP